MLWCTSLSCRCSHCHWQRRRPCQRRAAQFPASGSLCTAVVRHCDAARLLLYLVSLSGFTCRLCAAHPRAAAAAATWEWRVRVGAVAPTAAAQRAALVELYIATNGSTWSDRTGWQNHTVGSDPCDNSWSGVSCDASSGAMERNMWVVALVCPNPSWSMCLCCCRF